MKSFLMAGGAALALVLVACGGGGADNNVAAVVAKGINEKGELIQIPAPNNGDWTATIRETERGFQMGNPDAPVKLVEYASITCPHCGQFSVEGGAEGITRYVRSGQVSWEYRPYMIFGTDPGLFALLRCQGPASFFQLTEQLYADQQNWMVRAQQYQERNRAEIQGADDPTAARLIVTGAGLDAFFRQRGMPQSRIDQCLADPRNVLRVRDDTLHAQQTDDPPGTPAFYINGQLQRGVGLWPQLEPALRQRLGG